MAAGGNYSDKGSIERQHKLVVDLTRRSVVSALARVVIFLKDPVICSANWRHLVSHYRTKKQTISSNTMNDTMLSLLLASCKWRKVASLRSRGIEGQGEGRDRGNVWKKDVGNGMRGWWQ